MLLSLLLPRALLLRKAYLLLLLPRFLQALDGSRDIAVLFYDPVEGLGGPIPVLLGQVPIRPLDGVFDDSLIDSLLDSLDPIDGFLADPVGPLQNGSEVLHELNHLNELNACTFPPLVVVQGQPSRKQQSHLNLGEPQNQ